MLRVVALLAALGALTKSAIAEPIRVFRFATVAPEGTAWARELHAWARDIENASHGAVRMKLYFGGIAGGETEVEEQIRRGRLDGAISGGMLCARAAPSLRVLRVLGLAHDRDEAIYLINRLRPTLDREFEEHGFVDLGIALLGMDLLFTRQPIRSLADMQRDRYWIWDLDDVVQKQLGALGVRLMPAPLPDAAALYDSGKVDGFSTIPGAALAFRWSAQAKYATPLGYTALPGCGMLTLRAFDELPFEVRQAIRAAAAKAVLRFEDVTRAQDEALLGGLFARQGVVVIPPSPRFREELSTGAAEAARRLGAQLVPPALLQLATQILADYRAHH